MNRQERRKTGSTREPVYNLTYSQIQQMKKDATTEAVNTAFILMMGLPIMVVHDKFGKIMKKEGREEIFAELLMEQYDSFEKGFFTLDDVKQVLLDECGLQFGG